MPPPPVGLRRPGSSAQRALKPITETRRRFNLSLTNNFKHLRNADSRGC